MEVHRCRFVEYQPEPINCVAFNQSGTLLALSRGNADIEIWNVVNDWHLECRLPGGEGLSVEAICWLGNRLFAAGIDGNIIEWDLVTLSPRNIVSSMGGAVWSLSLHHEGKLLAAGCEDGCVRLFDVAVGVDFAKAFDKQKGRILSVCFSNDGSVIATGASDNTIHKYAVTMGRSVLRITAEDFHKESTLIWSVKVLSNGNLISGDSLGNTQMWDGKFGTLLQSFRVHEADVLSLALSKDEKTLFAGSVDGKLVRFEQVSETSKAGIVKSKWVQSGKCRAHTHDIRTVAINDSNMDIVSGGVDTNLVVYTMEGFDKSSFRKLPPFPQSEKRTFVCKQAKVLMYQHSRKIQIWSLGKSKGSESVERRSAGTRLGLAKTPKLMLDFRPKTDDNIMCSSISDSASFVAYADLNSVKLFKLDVFSKAKSMKKVKGIPEELEPAHRILFTPDEKRMIVATNTQKIQVLDLETMQVIHSFSIYSNEMEEDDEDEDVKAPIISLEISDDGQWLACGDLKNNIWVYNMDTCQIHSKLPVFQSQHTCIAFNSAHQAMKEEDMKSVFSGMQKPLLFIACCSNEIFAYNVEQKKLNAWSKENSMNLPKPWLEKKEKIIGIGMHPQSPSKVIFYDHKMFTVVDISEPVPKLESLVFGDAPKKGNKDVPSTKNFLCYGRYRPLLFCGFSSESSMIVVERPWLQVMESFPPTLYRTRYGT
eukprot:Nk52_evm63s1992 gene=Nk52_evmTU63s1992